MASLYARSIDPILTTQRLLLRRWQPADREPFARLNADSRVRAHFPSVLSRQESDAQADRIEDHFRRYGFGLYALELRTGGGFIGYAGLAVPDFHARFTPCVEIGWRLAAEYLNQGLATEAARAIVRYAFDALALEELVSCTVPANLASIRVMEKIGMTFDSEFEHPLLPEGHPLRRHVLYRLRRPAPVL